MEPKKNPKKDINRNRGLYFVSGLALILLLTYVALELKFYEKKDYVSQSMNQEDDLREEVPLIIHFTPPPPPPPPAPPVFEIAPDDPEIVETFFGTTETNIDEPTIEVPDIPDVEPEPDIEVPFVALEHVPVFPGCENDSDKKACFQKMITKHIKKTQRYPEEAQKIGAQGRVNVIFTIQKNGEIANVRMKGPHASLEKEASRIIGKLPKMMPGKQRGKPVKVSFSQPIVFRLQ